MNTETLQLGDCRLMIYHLVFQHLVKQIEDAVNFYIIFFTTLRRRLSPVKSEQPRFFANFHTEQS